MEQLDFYCFAENTLLSVYFYEIWRRGKDIYAEKTDKKNNKQSLRITANSNASYRNLYCQCQCIIWK